MKKAIDLFAGCGGLSLGFTQNGFQIVKAVEFDPTIAETYRRNFPETELFVNDIKEIDESDVFSDTKVDVVIGGPPCQGFSMAGARIRNGFVDDPRNYLFKHYLNIVKKTGPKVFIMENVKGMLSMQKGRVFAEIRSSFEDQVFFEGHPYSLYWRVVKASDFGVPQNRERLVVVGAHARKVDFDQAWERARIEVESRVSGFFDRVTIRDAIGNMPNTTAGGIVANPFPTTDYQRYLASSEKTITNHKASRHSKKAVERMSKIGQGENYAVLDEEIRSVHSGSYGRLRWGDQSVTITTRFDTPAGGRFIHPDLNRTITPREAARIQSFPDSFCFKGDNRSISRQIGNAVPPKLAYFLSVLADELILQVQESESVNIQ